ncbi:MAG: 4-(cytidine 5'-diphospho)-2-C-methyl-D-erythritol kinase [Oscillospiraceae bacterium]|nr:4-(cytidine 5'-diphospho)-2-C-methyl-D-erythritol kinase [Oscillospiraceae bacterium]
MTTLYESAYAKINLTLDVLGVRPDGYHDLKSVMQTVSLCDDIEIDIGTGKPWCLKCEAEGVPLDERNLAWKAAQVFFAAIGKDPEGLEIRMVKRIPSQAGLGGGSSDAAAVFRALNRHYGMPMTTQTLADLSAKVGSDVPFCVLGGTVMVEGRGEFVRKLKDMPACHIVICKPEFPVSTPALYRKLDECEITKHPNNDAMEAAINAGKLTAIAQSVHNVFDPVVAAEHPEIDHIKSVCAACGALAQQMSGSGSATFAIMSDRASAIAACEKLKENYRQVFLAEPV